MVNSGKLDLAIESHMKAIELKPESVNAYYNLAICYKDKGNIDKAIETWETASSMAPKNYLYPYNIAICYMEMKEFEKAREKFNLVLSLQPDPEMELLARKNLETIDRLDEPKKLISYAF